MTIGWRQNMAMEPVTASPSTQRFLTGPAYFLGGAASAWINSATQTSPQSMLLSTVGQGGRGSMAHCTVDLAAHGVSTETAAGGLDPGDPFGSLQPNQLYNMFVVMRDPSFAPNDWGLVYVLGSGPSGRAATAGPSGTCQAVYPYYCPIDFFFTNGSASGVAWKHCKQDHVWNMIDTFVEIAAGAASAWTPIFSDPPFYGLPQNTGTWSLILAGTTAGTSVQIAPDVNAPAGYVACSANGPGGGVYNYSRALLTPNGSFGWASTDPQGFV
ncbi:MAG: hypothetical protein JO128_21285, partial [Alphaproteobacteria bacterium]|nr:hypothetical protein [Alphaproteobacteria bacterium]